MYSFLVLGIIPGTDVAISFQAWLIILAGLTVSAMIFQSLLRHIWESANRAVRLPLPASQLHQRIRPTAR
jgi:divalent metal cation (Fe/Co/Zn/Cd) transporter